MYADRLSVRTILLTAVAVPIVAFSAYVAWIVVPVVIREVVPEVVRAVLEN